MVALYDKRQRQRLAIKPGLTGPVSGWSRRTELRKASRSNATTFDNLTIAGDIGILLRTPKAVIRGDGAF